MEIIHTKYLWRRQTIKETINERMEKKLFQQCVEKNKIKRWAKTC